MRVSIETNRGKIYEAEEAAKEMASLHLSSYCSNLYLNTNKKRGIIMTSINGGVMIQLAENGADAIKMIDQIEAELLATGEDKREELWEVLP